MVELIEAPMIMNFQQNEYNNSCEHLYDLRISNRMDQILLSVYI